MDHYADDFAELATKLDLKNAIMSVTPPAAAKSPAILRAMVRRVLPRLR
jgi:hypothetical protein